MSSPAGWYDDPQDSTQQRYWDGDAWTEQRRPRETPPPQQGAVYPGAPPYQPGAHHPSPYQPSPYQQGPYQQGQYQQGQYQQGQYQQGQYQQGQYQQGQYQQGPQQGAQQHPGAQYQGMPPAQYGGQPHPQGFGYGPMVPSTPDGVELSGWWRRVGARLLDGLIVLIAGLPLTGYFLYQYTLVVIDYQREVMDRAMAGETQFTTNLPAEAYKWAIPATIIGLLIGLAYEYFFLTRSGATPGKRALGISVRLREQPGPPPPVAVLKRFALYNVFSLLGGAPTIGSIFGLLGLLNYLWPLWDDKKQALHDKWATTNVVRGPQPR